MQAPIESNKLSYEKEPYYVLSKHRNWITVTPERKNRNKSLEKMKCVIF